MPGPTRESPLAGWLIRVQRLQMLELQLRLNTLLFSAFGNMPIQHPSPQLRSASQHRFGDLDAVPHDRGHPKLKEQRSLRRSGIESFERPTVLRSRST